MAEPNTTLCYELKGRSHAAALALQLEIEVELKKSAPQSTGNLAEIGQSWQAFYARLVARLEKENPVLLQDTGLCGAAIQIKQSPSNFPRAYAVQAQIFQSPQQRPRFFMYVPADYAGQHFAPADARLLTGQDETNAGNLLFAGGWLGNAPLVALPRRGVPLPLQAKVAPIAPADDANGTAFIAAGQSLALVRDYEARLAEYNARVETAFAAIRAAAEKLYPQILSNLPQGEGLYVNLSYLGRAVAGADTSFTFSIRRDGHGGNPMLGGQPVAVPESRDFHTVAHQNDMVIITRDDTAEGRELKAVLYAVPKRPQLSEYPVLCRVGVPNLLTQGSYKILRYRPGEKISAATVPPDAQPFPQAALQWLMDDAADLRQGDLPPPVPAEVVALLTTAGTSKTRPFKKSI